MGSSSWGPKDSLKRKQAARLRSPQRGPAPPAAVFQPPLSERNPRPHGHVCASRTEENNEVHSGKGGRKGK